MLAWQRPASADFVKTSTDRDREGGTVADVVLMRRNGGVLTWVSKVAGGVRDPESLKAMVAAGATRVGASAGVKIVQESKGQSVSQTQKVRLLITSVLPSCFVSSLRRYGLHNRNFDSFVLERLLHPPPQLPGDVPLSQRQRLHPHADRHTGVTKIFDAKHFERREHGGAENGTQTRFAWVQSAD